MIFLTFYIKTLFVTVKNMVNIFNITFNIVLCFMFYPWSEVYCLPASYATVVRVGGAGGWGWGECKCRKGRRTDGWLLGDLQGLYPSIRGKKANNVVGG